MNDEATPVEIGRIVIMYYMDDTDTLTSFDVIGDIPAVIVLGLLRMAEDTYMRKTMRE